MTSSNSLINIGGDSNDPHYRYKREKVRTIFNNKDSTTLVNITQIAKQLKVDPSQITNYLQKKCGMTIFGFSIRSKNKIAEESLENQLEKFIREFVLCPKCKLPELKDGGCNACGYSENSSKNFLVKDEKEDECKPIPVQDIIISKVLHYLYDFLEYYENRLKEQQEYMKNLGEIFSHFNKEQIGLIEKCIDYCWNSESENQPYRKIEKINKRLTEYKIRPFDIKELSKQVY